MAALSGIRQPPLDTTLMGCLVGASRQCGIDVSVPMLFGLTGHAFLINIADDVCPSSPYVWNKARFRELLGGLGIDTVAEYAVDRMTSAAIRSDIEAQLRAHFDQGHICVMNFLEHQLIAGYDAGGFLLARPWQHPVPSLVDRIEFGSWDPCLGREGWVGVSVLQVQPRGLESADAPAMHWPTASRSSARLTPAPSPAIAAAPVPMTTGSTASSASSKRAWTPAAATGGVRRCGRSAAGRQPPSFRNWRHP